MGLRLQRRNSGRQAQLPVHRTLVTRLHRDEKNQPSSGRKWNRRHWQARHHPAGVRMSLSPPRKSSAQRLAVAPSPPFVFGFLVLGLACCTTAHTSLAAASRKAALRCDAWASHRGGFSCEAAALGRTGFRSSCTRAWLLRGLWHLPRPGVKSMSPLLAGRPLSAVPPGKPSFTSGGWNTPHTVQSVYNCLIMCFS